MDKAQTRYEIQNALPEIIRGLADTGVQIKRVEVVMTQNSEQQPLKDQSMASAQEGFVWQQNSANPDTRGNSSSWVGANEWLTGAEQYTAAAEQQMQLTENSINVLI